MGCGDNCGCHYRKKQSSCEDPKCTNPPDGKDKGLGGKCLEKPPLSPIGYEFDTKYCGDNCGCYFYKKPSSCEDPKCTNIDIDGGLGGKCLDKPPEVSIPGYEFDTKYCGENCGCHYRIWIKEEFANQVVASGNHKFRCNFIIYHNDKEVKIKSDGNKEVSTVSCKPGKPKRKSGTVVLVSKTSGHTFTVNIAINPTAIKSATMSNET